MREIFEKEIIDYYLKKQGVQTYFNSQNLNYHLFRYENAEIISFIKPPTDYIQFVVDGCVQIYVIREDGTQSPIHYVNSLTILGDIEFSGNTNNRIISEAKEIVYCIGIQLSECRSILENDVQFLQSLLASVSRKMSLFMESESVFQSVEKKLLNYMAYKCDNKTISGVDVTCFQLRCSRRQIQRVLKDLSDRGLIRKVGKGKYTLNS